MKYEKALEIAHKAHYGQVDKAGNAYINHPVTVASYVKSPQVKVVAVLHDVVEDTEITLNQLVDMGLSRQQLEALVLLTHSKDEDYFCYINRIKANSIARQVKLADLKHNSDLSRLPNPTKKDFERVEKYKQAIKILN